jgi:hypothetical protein
MIIVTSHLGTRVDVTKRRMKKKVSRIIGMAPRSGFLNRRVVEDFQRVLELFAINTKYCFNGQNKGYFEIKIYSNMYFLNTLMPFLLEGGS